jgi:hypothetical protein
MRTIPTTPGSMTLTTLENQEIGGPWLLMTKANPIFRGRTIHTLDSMSPPPPCGTVPKTAPTQRDLWTLHGFPISYCRVLWSSRQGHDSEISRSCSTHKTVRRPMPSLRTLDRRLVKAPWPWPIIWVFAPTLGAAALAMASCTLSFQGRETVGRDQSKRLIKKWKNCWGTHQQNSLKLVPKVRTRKRLLPYARLD